MEDTPQCDIFYYAVFVGKKLLNVTLFVTIQRLIWLVLGLFA